MMGEAKAANRTLRWRVARWMRKRGWHHKTPNNGLRHRLLDIIDDHRPWWDWGHRLMTLVGRDFCGSWSEPSPPTWWYRLGPPKHMWRTRYPIHPLSTYEVVTDYDTFRERTAGLNEDEMYEWQAINVNQDGELQFGHRYWGGKFYGLRECDVALVRRYLRMWRRLDWWGLRSWLYKQGLHAAVHARKPGACNASPPKGQGGHDHWYCRQRRGHKGMHRFNSYTWGEIDGEPIGAFWAAAAPERETP